jgi:N-acetylglucosamine-6-phosphate deacetylase
MASTCPADFLGAQDLGRIEVGARADLVELCPDIEVRSTWIGGQREFAF